MLYKLNKIQTVLITAIFFFCVTFDLFAVTDKKRIFDDANLLSSTEQTLIQDELKRISVECDAEFFIVTRKQLENQNIEQLARSIFRENAGSNGSGAVLAISMRERDINYTAFGSVFDRHRKRLDRIREQIGTKMTSQNYYDAFMLFAKLSSSFGFWANYQEFMPMGFMVSAVLTFITVIILIFIHKGINTVDSKTYAVLGSFKLTNAIDKYLRTSTTKTRISKSSSGGSRGGSRSGSSSGKF